MIVDIALIDYFLFPVRHLLDLGGSTSSLENELLLSELCREDEDEYEYECVIYIIIYSSESFLEHYILPLPLLFKW